MHALIPELSTLPPHILSEVQVTFADSLAVLWRVLAAIASGVIGLLTSLFMRGLDANWVLKSEKTDQSI